MTFALYFDDDSDSRIVVRALAGLGFDALRASDAGMRGVSDHDHLTYATGLGRVLVTFNRGDFLQLHSDFLSSDRHHAGIVVVLQQHYSPGEQIRRFERLLKARSAGEMRDWVEFLSDWGAAD